jgi:TonB family protein
MLDRLLETGPRQKKSAWGGVASVIVHSGIIAIAVCSTAVAKVRPTFHGDPIIPIVPPPSTSETHSAPAGGTGKGGAPRPDLPRIPTVGPSIDVELPPPASDVDTAAADDSLLAEIGSGGGSAGGATLDGARGFASEALLDVPVRVVTERTPLYPEMLRAAAIAGVVRLQFVVDTAGRAELSSVRVLDSTHELFTRAVLASLRQARFTAGQLNGRRVRTLVERSYRFDIGGAQ